MRTAPVDDGVPGIGARPTQRLVQMLEGVKAVNERSERRLYRRGDADRRAEAI